MIPVSYNVRSLWVRRATTLAAGLGIGLVVFVFASVLMLSHGIERTLQSTGSDDNAIVLRKGSQAELTSGIDESAASLLRAAPEAAPGAAVAAELVVLIMAPRAATGHAVGNVIVRGVAPESFALRQQLPQVRLGVDTR